MFMIKSDIMQYNYEIRHVKGEANCIADCLSRWPAWLISKDKKSDCDQDPIRVANHGSRDELCLKVITEARHLLRANPTLSTVEKMGQKDPDYKIMIQYIRAKKNFRDLSPHSEGFRMGEKWPNLEILPEFEVIILRETSSVSKIYPPCEYRPLILEELYKSGRKSDSVFLRARLH